jgi:hypothetical protein
MKRGKTGDKKRLIAFAEECSMNQPEMVNLLAKNQPALPSSGAVGSFNGGTADHVLPEHSALCYSSTNRKLTL